MSRSTAGCSGVKRGARFAFPRSIASVYCVRSFVPMLKNDASPTKLSADSFVGDASFFSIGTNDLTQYTLAIDRGNANLAPRFTPLHPAVLRLIQRTVEVGDATGIEVTVCGEMASQPLTAFALIGLGVRSMSA